MYGVRIFRRRMVIETELIRMAHRMCDALHRRGPDNSGGWGVRFFETKAGRAWQSVSTHDFPSSIIESSHPPVYCRRR